MLIAPLTIRNLSDRKLPDVEKDAIEQRIKFWDTSALIKFS